MYFNLAGMDLWLSSLEIVSDNPAFKMAAVTRDWNIFNCLLLLCYKSKWAQILTAATWPYLPVFSVWFFSVDLYSVLIRHIMRKNHIKIFCSKIWSEMIFDWPSFKIICNAPIFYKLLLQVKLKTSWAITGSREPPVH